MFNPWVRMIPWIRAWLPTPVFLPGESHEQRSLAGYSPQGCRVRHNGASTTHTGKESATSVIPPSSTSLFQPDTLTLNLPKKFRVPLRCLNDIQGSLSLIMILYILNATMQSCLFLFYTCQSLFLWIKILLLLVSNFCVTFFCQMNPN